MPELPEVETSCRGIRPHIVGKTVADIIVRQPRLRWPIPQDLAAQCRGHSIKHVTRRAKYLLLATSAEQTILIHLGMSGSLRIIAGEQAAAKHDHVDFVFSDQTLLRFNDPRRFGAILLTHDAIAEHKLIRSLGPEPLSAQFNGEYLYRLARNKTAAVKAFIMDGCAVVGVGNIYASESLFRAGIRPTRPAQRISLKRYQSLAKWIKIILQQAIEQGGTTLRDFVDAQGKPGYFQQYLAVYGRSNEACINCSTIIRQTRIAQRNSYFCPLCQR